MNSEFPQVPFVDLSRRVARHRSTIDSAIRRVLDSGNFILGKEVSRFESLFANFIGVNHGLCVANGTDALEIALRALGVGSSTKVATVANAGNYTTSALNSIGAKPIYMDVDYSSRNVTLKEVKSAVSAGATVVVITHLYGLAVSEIQEISDFCMSKSIPMIEDCAQAHGAKLGDKVVGSFGDAAAFSFYPTKNLGSLGDVGLIATNSPEVAERIAKLRTYGWDEKYSVALIGGRNSRADAIQAALLADLLPSLEIDNQRRRDIALMYSAGIKAKDISLPKFDSEEFVAHLYVIATPKRSEYIQKLKDAGIATAIHFPIPDTNQPYLNSNVDTRLPITEKLSAEVFSLPCYPELTNEEIERVVQALK